MKKDPSIPRPEFPRPDRQRRRWQSLNGPWDFAFIDGPRPADRELADPAWRGDRRITVPFAWQAPLSGVADSGPHSAARYRRRFRLEEELSGGGGTRVFLHFGAVDYRAEVWLDGRRLGAHEGGYAPFSFELPDLDAEAEHVLDLYAEDGPDLAQPRGKQAWTEKPDRCWYTPSSGIWQSVWLEAVGSVGIERFFLTPNLEDRCLEIDAELDGELEAAVPDGAISGGAEGVELVAEVRRDGKPFLRSGIAAAARRVRLVLPIREPDGVDEVHHWTPEHPVLFDLTLTVRRNGLETDRVETYFAMRSVRVVAGRIYLNERPLRQRLVLDQGYWPDGLLTPPSDQAIVDDILWAKKLGFNGVRKHQKAEDPRFYYWADRLGLLVWGEQPSAYEFSRSALENTARDWLAFLARDYNHPCIIAWVPFNESWGVRNIVFDRAQQALVQGLVQLTRAFDPTRLVIGNDGWEWVESDFIGLHDYSASAAEIRDKLADLDRTLRGSFGGNRRALADGQSRTDQPVLVTEMGGIAFRGDSGWGYSGAAADEEDFFRRLEAALDALDGSGRLEGWCYTQLTDVFQETNGLLTMDRKPKVDAERLAAVFSRKNKDRT